MLTKAYRKTYEPDPTFPATARLHRRRSLFPLSRTSCRGPSSASCAPCTYSSGNLKNSPAFFLQRASHGSTPHMWETKTSPVQDRIRYHLFGFGGSPPFSEPLLQPINLEIFLFTPFGQAPLHLGASGLIFHFTSESRGLASLTPHSLSFPDQAF